jgi:hypothetical protein
MHLRAKHVMSKPPIYFRQIEKVSIVHRVRLADGWMTAVRAC